MAEYNNPAGRLHFLLSRFASQPSASIAGAWANALQVNEEDLMFHLGRVAGLLPEVQQAADETNSSAFEPMRDHLAALSKSIFPTNVGFNEQAQKVRPRTEPMQMLATLAFALDATRPEGEMPEDSEIEELRESLRSLIEEVTAAALPPDVRRALLNRLSEVLEALDHLATGGAEAVRRAAEALATATLIHSDVVEVPGIVEKLATMAQKAWVLFAIGGTLVTATQGWIKVGDAVGLIESGEPPAQRALPAGPPSSESDEIGRP